MSDSAGGGRLRRAARGYGGAAIALRAAMIAVLVALAVGLGSAALRASAGPWAMVIEAMAPDFRVTAIGPARVDGVDVIQAEVMLARTLYLGGRVQAPNPAGRAQARVPASQPLQGPLLALALALGWPVSAGRAGPAAAGARRWAEPAARAAVALPLAALLWFIDTPLALAASLWRLVLQAMAPGSGSALVAAADLMTDGGRLAFAVAIGLAAVVMGRMALWHRHGSDTHDA